MKSRATEESRATDPIPPGVRSLDSSFPVGALGPPTVSIIVTNYNYQTYVVDCLDSILAQTSSPMEYIVVDDCSTDDSIRVIEEFIRSKADGLSVQLVKLSENAGQMNAFIEGFRRSSGSFVVFVDADDYLFPDFVETHLAAHLNTQYPSALTCSNQVIVDGNNRALTGSIEKAHRQQRPEVRLAPSLPVRAFHIDDWRETWVFGETTTLRQQTQPLLHVASDANDLREFLWSSTSGAMFRRGVLEVVLRDTVRDIRISADSYLFHFCHLLGGTTLIQTSHGFYRRHGSNNFSSLPTIGRGVRTWRTQGEWTRDNLLGRIENEVLTSLSEFTALLGEPRTLQLLATLVPAHRTLRVFRALKGRPLATLQFLVLLVIKTFKKAWLQIIKVSRVV